MCDLLWLCWFQCFTRLMVLQLLEPSLASHLAQLLVTLAVNIARIKSSSCSTKALCAGGCSAETCKEREEGLVTGSSNTCFISELPSLSFWSKADLGAEASLDTFMCFGVV